MSEPTSPGAAPRGAATLPADVAAVVPMRNAVLFPHLMSPIALGRAKSLAALQHASATGSALVLVLQRSAQDDDPALSALHEIGTLVTVLQRRSAEDGQVHAVCQGLQRVRLRAPLEGLPFLAAHFEPLEETDTNTTKAQALAIQLRDRGSEILSMMPGVPAEIAHVMQATRSPSQLADLAGSLLDMEPAEKQQLLETLSTEQRLEKVLQLAGQRLEVLRLSQEISQRTRGQLEDRQRRALLEEQMRAIRKELGENGENTQEMERLGEAVTAAKMPPDVEAQVRKELQRLGRMHEAGGEASTLRNWI